MPQARGVENLVGQKSKKNCIYLFSTIVEKEKWVNLSGGGMAEEVRWAPDREAEHNKHVDVYLT